MCAYLCGMLTAVMAIVFLAIAFAGIAIKILLKKDGQFAGTCASNNPLLQEQGASCGLCGARPDEQCMQDDLPEIKKA